MMWRWHLSPQVPPDGPRPTGPTPTTHESGRVVIADGLGVAKGLQGRIGLDDLVLQGALVGWETMKGEGDWVWTPLGKGHHQGGVAPGPTLLLLAASFLRSPMAAMVAKYWMTLLVLTVFPAPDSPLGWATVRCWRISWWLLHPTPPQWGRAVGGGNIRDEDGLVLAVCREKRGVR